jgi:hypothetical protein
MVIAAFFVTDGAQAQNAAKIGVASAVKNRVEGSTGGGARPLSAGSSVFAREVVRTGDESAAQLLFLDETSLSIGPQSEVTLDRFVFDPNRGTGNVVINLGKGALRFATGSQKPSNYQIRTPVATIGVRGTLFDVYATKDKIGQWIVILILVQGGVTANDHVLSKAGEALIFTSGGVQRVNWQTSLFALIDTLSFPLFGRYIHFGQIELPDGATDRLDQHFGSGPTFDPYGN